MKRTHPCTRLFLPLLLLAGCGRDAQPPTPVSFFVASSLTDVAHELTKNFEAQTSFRVEITPGSSSTLAHQISQGAEADVFLPAGVKDADSVATNQQGSSRIAERVDLLSNRLVVVVPKTSQLKLESLEGLALNEIEDLALADPKTVPAGIYAKEALTKAGLWDRLEEKIIGGDNVKTTLTFVAKASAQAGIVYATDAQASRDVKVAIAIDPTLHSPIRYPLVLMRRGDRNPGARMWFDYLRSPAAASVFKKHGFSVLSVGQAAK